MSSNRSTPAGAASDAEVLRRNARLTRRSFLTGGIAALAGVGTWQWLRNTQLLDGIPWPLRRVLQFNEGLAELTFRETRLAPEFAPGAAALAADMRVNGHIGLTPAANAAPWVLHVEHDDGRRQQFDLDQVRSLPKASLVTELKCIEGWSQVIAWAGTSLRDFALRHRLGTRSGAAPDLDTGRDDLYRYVALETPDAGYYVGLDIASALHPQTLLCYEMGGEPLTPSHGAPLRLAIPLKYGIKNIKRIGRIRFTDTRPTDYWAERGYDWYAGH